MLAYVETTEDGHLVLSLHLQEGVLRLKSVDSFKGAKGIRDSVLDQLNDERISADNGDL